MRIGIVTGKEWLFAVKPLLERALERDDENDWRDVKREFKSGHSQLWVVLEGDFVMAAAITRLLPTEGVTEFWLCGGIRAKEWVAPLIYKVRMFASDEGCPRLRLTGRAGWVRLLPEWEVVARKGGLVLMELSE